MAEEKPQTCMEDELKCIICLEAFKTPVTLPCGHSFCKTCLDDTWKESLILFCPQCRHLYPNKPELQKNTTPSAVVESFKKSPLSESDQTSNVKVCTTETEVVRCDTCMEVNAIKTCLTCMASYCEDHIKPHHINQVFRAHQLVDPIKDLQKYICQDHVKFREFFCQKHNFTFCSTCLQFHRDCEYTTLQEGRAQKESEMKGMLIALDTKIDMTNTVMAQVREQQLQLQDAAAGHKRSMRMEYDFIRHLIDSSEQEALKDVDKALGSSQAKIQSLFKRFSKNVDKMTAVKMELNNLLSNADSLAFLQASVNLPRKAKTDPQCPLVNMDSEAVVTGHSSAVAVKELLRKILALPAENRIAFLQADCTEVPEMASSVPKMAYDKMGAQSVRIPCDISTAVKRSDLLQFGTTLKFDPRTAHRHIVLSKDLTTASRSSEPCPYPDGPQRFSACPQVLCSTGFLQGQHYWEVKVSGTRLCGLGLAYGSMNRRLPSSRLGLNAESWCLEMFNDKLSAWHKGVETVLDNPGPKRVGLLLDCDHGSVSFYMVADRAYPFVMFALHCTEAIYPALWISSTGSSISLCKLIS